MGGAARHHGDARTFNGYAHTFHQGPRCGQIADVLQARLGLDQAVAGKGRIVAKPRHGGKGRFQPPTGDRPLALGTGSGAVGFGDALIRRTALIAGQLIGPRCVSQSRLQRVMCLHRAVSLGRSFL
jgi:hypothetical protein